MNDLKADIDSLPPELVTEVLKNIRITLEHDLSRTLSDADVATELQQLPLDGAVADLRGRILDDAQDPETVDRWGKALLAMLASDDETRPLIVEAIEDAKVSSTMDIVIPSLLILGAVVVLLKWRPKTLEVKPKGGLRIEWDENDVGVVSDLAKAAASTAVKTP